METDKFNELSAKYSETLHNEAFKLEFRERFARCLSESTKLKYIDSKPDKSEVFDSVNQLRLWLKEIFGISENDELPEEIEVLSTSQWIHGLRMPLSKILEFESENLHSSNNVMVERLRLRLKDKCPTAEQWAKMSIVDLDDFEYDGKKIHALSTLLGVKKPIIKKKAYLELGRKIFGENHECLQYKEKGNLSDYSDEEIIQEIKREIPTPEIWAKLKPKYRMKLRIFGKGISALATRFGINRSFSPTNKDYYLMLGRLIYGEDHECLKGTNKEQLKKDILEVIPTPKKWADMKGIRGCQDFRNGWNNLRIKGKGLSAIGIAFGFQKLTEYDHENYFKLGRIIYGPYHPCLWPKLHPKNHNLMEHTWLFGGKFGLFSVI